ncbi:MAG: type VI secretion system baseplate subunit TssG [Syntrophaceae bacterium]
MAPQKRRAYPALKERLLEQFQRFSFFEAVHLLERLAADKPPLGEGLEPSQEPVRFAVRPSFTFPAAEIASLAEDLEGGPARMDVTFLGLTGPNGVLPHWYNELAIERNRQADFSLTDFLDIFHHRLITLFYLAWKKHRWAENYQPSGQDRLSRCLLSLCGLGTPGLGENIGFESEALAFNTGLLSMPFPTAAGIESAVACLAGVEVAIEQFVERVIPLSPADQTAVGQANARLGMDTVCGGYVRDCQSTFRIDLGPMDYADFTRFLPGGETLKPLEAFIRTMVGPEYEFELKVMLNRAEVPICRLGGESRLGMTSWLLAPGTHPDKHGSITIAEGAVA